MASHNGATTLNTVLAKYLELKVPKGGYKIVIVDNASTDDTQEILDGFKDRLPLTVLRIEEQGKNIALNYGLNHAEGDLIVFTDDDAVPDSNWLVEMRKAANSLPEYTFFAGSISAIWPYIPPKWILEHVQLGAVYGITDENLQSGPINSGLVWGANMAIRANVFKHGHRFNDNYGPSSGQYIMGGETEFIKRLSELGHLSWFIKKSVVGHLIREYQMQKSWIIKRAFRLGKLKYILTKDSFAADTHLLFGAPYCQLRKMISHYIDYFIGYVFCDELRVFRAEWRIQILKGYYSESSNK